MLRFKILSFVSLLSLCTAETWVRCGNEPPNQSFLDTLHSFAATNGCIRSDPYYQPPKLHVDTYVHVIAPSEDEKDDAPVSYGHK